MLRKDSFLSNQNAKLPQILYYKDKDNVKGYPTVLLSNGNERYILQTVNFPIFGSLKNGL